MGDIEKGSLETFVKENIMVDRNGKRDLCPIYSKSEKLQEIINYLAEPFRGNVDYVASPESLGFILGSMLADELKVGFIPIRNAFISPLPDDDVVRAAYVDHNNNARSLQIRKSNLPENSHILLVDDWIGTAATMQTSMTIMEEAECIVEGIVSIGAEYNDATKRIIDEGILRSVIICK